MGGIEKSHIKIISNHVLVREFQHKLQNTRVADGGSNDTETTRPNITSRVRKGWRIGDVECLCAELQIHVSVNGRGLCQGQIEVALQRSTEDIACRVAVVSSCRSVDGRGSCQSVVLGNGV